MYESDLQRESDVLVPGQPCRSPLKLRNLVGSNPNADLHQFVHETGARSGHYTARQIHGGIGVEKDVLDPATALFG